eukprot:TRINITY_DN3707_c0_g1_i1.p1 TRINITY_DN3707_c0_g1~~TRINITY_DN3707_c0_g1_i1.p1  ORF type:complete len:159 (-),score=47.98 TRINITY_DN3707_c0_g1_i1:16-435(-)
MGNEYGTRERDVNLYAKLVKGFDPHVRNTQRYGTSMVPDHIETSKEVQYLIAKLLQNKVRKRYTASEALTHPWIVNRAHLNDEKISRHLVSRLVGFNNLCQFKLVITKIFRNQFYKMRPEHFHQLEQLFIQFDKITMEY